MLVTQQVLFYRGSPKLTHPSEEVVPGLLTQPDGVGLG